MSFLLDEVVCVDEIDVFGFFEVFKGCWWLFVWVVFLLLFVVGV